MTRTLVISIAWLCLADFASAAADDLWRAGPLFHESQLTLTPGNRTEALGPLFNTETQVETSSWAIPPLMSAGRDIGADAADFDFLYPLLTYNRVGNEYRFQIVQLFSFAGGRDQAEDETQRFTVFPFYFQQRSPKPEENYTALWPFYGHLQNRLFRSEVEFVLWPLYSKTQRRPQASSLPDDAFLDLGGRFLSARRGEITTYNYVYPFFHLRYGDGLAGWQFWPLYGTEHKAVTTRTNNFGDVDIVGGHDKRFILWPFYFNLTVDIGTDNPKHQEVWVPFYSSLRSPQRDSTSYLWPLGLTITEDRARQYREVDAPWPFIVFARGTGKNTTRVWPLYSHAANTNLESGFYLWPFYKYNRLHVAPLERDRTRVLFFLYSRTTERNTEADMTRRRADLWPLYSYKQDWEGNTRLQWLAPLEPFAPYSRSIERNYSPLWALWRDERNAQTGAASQSFLWNCYRRETTPDSKKCSLLFGLFQYESSSQGRRVRLFYVPLGKTDAPAPKPAE